MKTSAPEIDPEKLFRNADKVLNCLAKLSSAVLRGDHQQMRLLAGDAVTIIVSLEKKVDNDKKGTIGCVPGSNWIGDEHVEI